MPGCKTKKINILYLLAKIQVFNRVFFTNPDCFTFISGEKLRNFYFISWKMLTIWTCRSHEENTALQHRKNLKHFYRFKTCFVLKSF